MQSPALGTRPGSIRLTLHGSRSTEKASPSSVQRLAVRPPRPTVAARATTLKQALEAGAAAAPLPPSHRIRRLGQTANGARSHQRQPHLTSPAHTHTTRTWPAKQCWPTSQSRIPNMRRSIHPQPSKQPSRRQASSRPFPAAPAPAHLPSKALPTGSRPESASTLLGSRIRSKTIDQSFGASKFLFSCSPGGFRLHSETDPVAISTLAFTTMRPLTDADLFVCLGLNSNSNQFHSDGIGFVW